MENKFNIDPQKEPRRQCEDISRKKALLTNHNLIDFAGSEITTLEIAIVLKELGYEVNVATFEYGNPIRAVLERWRCANTVGRSGFFKQIRSFSCV